MLFLHYAFMLIQLLHLHNYASLEALESITYTTFLPLDDSTGFIASYLFMIKETPMCNMYWNST